VREHLAGHATGGGASLIAVAGSRCHRNVTIRWQSNDAGFRDYGVPLVHQIAVAGPSRRLGVATPLMDAAKELARDRGVMTLGIAVGLFD
jgi:GNAT superfamily N-acetyltransferase